MGVVRGILALALLGVLTASDAVASSSSHLGVNTVNSSLSRDVQSRPAITVEKPAAALQGQTAPAAVTGHATSLGSSTPQSLGAPAASQPSETTIPAAPVRPAPCPAGHLGLVCTAP
jgi:hypothetical protein